ncbi:3-deoxy-D-manno-oct-2-ulosonate III transferase WaaZ [Kosakonia sp. BYX6]|uniref:3-deoxy-D-manno-oct-2-ulosonate III transferase WaaZ n=1 Tax=Kosakonia calanthes TaxID=3139408 RepID=A0ABZ3B6G1_9ENTR
MNNIKYITHACVERLIKHRNSEDVVIFLSGPTSKKTPLSILRNKDVIAVNGSAAYLIDNNITPFIYTLTDARFLLQRRDDFYKFSRNSRFTVVNTDVYEEASEEDKKYLRENCLILQAFYKREKGGIYKKLKLSLKSRLHKSLLIDVPWSKKSRLVGFSTDIAIGYCSCHTVAYTAIQIAYSLQYSLIVCSGLDLTNTCRRFYDESASPMPSELSNDLHKIIPFFKYMREKVSDINIYNLSDDTAISYDIIPFIKPDEIDKLCYRSSQKYNEDINFDRKLDTLAN